MRYRFGETDAGILSRWGCVKPFQLLESSGEAPASVLLVAAVRGAATTGLAMSPQVELAIGAAEAEIVSELARLGYPPLRSWVPAAAAV